MSNVAKPVSFFSTLVVSMSLILFCAVVASAASYARITLKELTTRAVAVVEVEVLGSKYPPLVPGQGHPRTLVDLKVVKTFKGNLGERFTLDTPGGINGNVITYVPDAPDFKIGERAIVFVKEPQAGLYMVQDLGLGKYNLVQRDGKTFVESTLCPKAIGAGVPMQNQDDLEANLLTRSIPYATFCKFVQSYASGELPEANPAVLAATLAPSTLHNNPGELAAVTASRLAAKQAEARNAWLALGGVVLVSALIAAMIVARRRKAKAAGAGSVAMVLAGSLLAGAMMGGPGAKAFVTFTQGTVWNLDTAVAGKVAGGKIIWKQSTPSKTNPAVFTSVQQSFDKWASVSGSRLSFTAGGPTATTLASSADAENILAWSTTPSNDFSANTLGITFSSFSISPKSFFLDGDIIFNDRDFDWSSKGFGNPASVSLHEIGHFVGLDHNTSDRTTVMFPFDGGLTSLSPDELNAAVALYPSGTQAPPPVTPPTTKPVVPTAVADASPKSGPQGTTVSFTSVGSAAGSPNAPIKTFTWFFGDGVSGTGPTVSHTYTAAGTFTVMLNVTDTAGGFGVATVTISIGKAATPLSANFKLNFAKVGKDSFSASFNAADVVAKARASNTVLVNGTVNIGDQPWNFSFNTSNGRSTNKDGVDLTMNTKTNVLTLKIANADLRAVLAGHGAVNDNVSGVALPVPIKVWFDDNTGNYLFSKVPFNYTAIKDKIGVGKF